jgi:hypothetical protein
MAKKYTPQKIIQYTQKNLDVIVFALGTGVVWKWISKSGFLFEANTSYCGLSFNINKTDHSIVAKFRLSTGYRF